MLFNGPGIAEKSEYMQILRIWQKCFSDSDEYVSNFFRWFEDDFVPMVYRKDGRVVSAFFALPCEFSLGGKIRKAWYLYAGCTDPEFRGNGYFGELVKLAGKLAAEKETGVTFLVPGEDSLYPYYEKYGYVACMTKRIYSMTREEFAESEMTERKPVPSFLWNEKADEYAVSEATGAKMISSGDCRAYICETDGTCIIYKCRFDDYETFRNAVLGSTGAEHFELYVDSGVSLSRGRYRTIRKGMIKIPGMDSDGVSEICADAYVMHTFE